MTKTIYSTGKFILAIIVASSLFLSQGIAQTGSKLKNDPALDKKVKAFLVTAHQKYGHLSVPDEDGQMLHDIIVKNNYKSALEIGTSTGISTVWIAWALSKTGGKMVTVEIDEGRHKQAIENVKSLGLDKYVDFRLGDAHVLVPQLKGPFDFAFSDADKGWLKNYFKDVDPNLLVGGCFVTHNVQRGGYSTEYIDFLKGYSNYETTLDSNGAGMSISYKK